MGGPNADVDSKCWWSQILYPESSRAIRQPTKRLRRDLTLADTLSAQDSRRFVLGLAVPLVGRRISMLKLVSGTVLEPQSSKRKNRKGVGESLGPYGCDGDTRVKDKKRIRESVRGLVGAMERMGVSHRWAQAQPRLALYTLHIPHSPPSLNRSTTQPFNNAFHRKETNNLGNAMPCFKSVIAAATFFFSDPLPLPPTSATPHDRLETSNTVKRVLIPSIDAL